MGYVPGFQHDLFLSYSRDDEEWVRCFEAALRRGVKDRLGVPVDVWQDVNNIRLGQNWQDEIASAIGGTASFVAILSPNWFTSEWCTRERRQFLGDNVDLARIKAGDQYRFLKIVKTPLEHKGHEHFLPELHHIEFYGEDSGPAEYVELEVESEEFRLRMGRSVAALATLLRVMRRSRERIFLATPAGDVEKPWKDLRTELRDQKYDVRPDGMLDGFADDLVLKEMDGALLSVHLLGPAYSAFAERQLRLAAESEKRLLVWTTPDIASADNRQQALLSAIRKGEGFAASMVLLEGISGRAMIREVIEALKPQAARSKAEATGARPRVYLLHDVTTRQDAAAARQLHSEIVQREALDVMLPQAGLSSSSAVEHHRQLLRDCDGLLLYRDAAPDPWFYQHVSDVLFAERLVDRPAMRSKAVVISNPAVLEGVTNVRIIPRSTGFGVTDLEPFLQPLRQMASAHAGV